MKREKISETIENINPKYIDEATEYKGAVTITPKNGWYKWVAVAACFAFLLGIGVPFAKDLFIWRDWKQTVDAVMLIEYENAYLEIIENPETIKKYGLKKEITEDLIGKHIVFLQKETPEAERSNYIVANDETDIELLEYAPAAYKAVRIFRDGDKYYYTLFCNYHVKSNESLPMKDAFEVYGIDDAADIVSITPAKGNGTWKASGKTITDRTVIADFFNEISMLPAFCFDDYHDIVFADELKELEGTGGDIGTEAYTREADDKKDLIIETKGGLRFAIWYFPSYGWIYISATMTHYQMSPEMAEWFENNIR